MFGCTGFLGRYLVSKLGKSKLLVNLLLLTAHAETLLGKMGTQVIVPYREEDEARIFKPMGDLGQIVRMVSSSMALLKSISYLKFLAKGMGSTERKFNSGMPASFRYCFQPHWKRLRD